MIYVTFILFTIYGIIRYDFHIFQIQTTNIKLGFPEFNKKRKRLVAFLLVYMILYTALSYRVGTDIGRYMYDFEIARWSDFDISSISLSYRQPLWVLLQLISKDIVDSFVFFRFITSVLVLGVVYWFLARETKYIFTAILFFFILMSFDLNFNILRQAMAISCFVISCYYLNKGDNLKSYVFIAASVLFHNSAFVLFAIPLLSKIDVKRRFEYSYLLFSLLCITLLFIPKDNFLFNMLLFSSDDTLSSLSNEYLNSEYGTSDFSVIKIIIHLGIFYFIGKYYMKSGASNCNMILYFLYILLFVSSSSIPIMGRIKYFFSIFYIIAVSNAIFHFLKTTHKFRNINHSFAYIIIISILLFTPVRYFFLLNPRTKSYNIIQYYPYYSVFNPQVSLEREKLVDY